MSHKRKEFIVRRFGVAGDFLYQEGKHIKLTRWMKLKMKLLKMWKELLY